MLLVNLSAYHACVGKGNKRQKSDLINQIILELNRSTSLVPQVILTLLFLTLKIYQYLFYVNQLVTRNCRTGIVSLQHFNGTAEATEIH